MKKAMNRLFRALVAILMVCISAAPADAQTLVPLHEYK